MIRYPKSLISFFPPSYLPLRQLITDAWLIAFEPERPMDYLAWMSTRFFFEDYTIEKDWQETELHYLVFDRQGYVCRLVPGEWGWELSAIDLNLDQPIPAELVAKLSDYILRLEA